MLPALVVAVAQADRMSALRFVGVPCGVSNFRANNEKHGTRERDSLRTANTHLYAYFPVHALLVASRLKYEHQQSSQSAQLLKMALLYPSEFIPMRFLTPEENIKTVLPVSPGQIHRSAQSGVVSFHSQQPPQLISPRGIMFASECLIPAKPKSHDGVLFLPTT